MAGVEAWAMWRWTHKARPCLHATRHEPRAHLRAEEELEKEINALMRKAEILMPRMMRRYGKGKLGS